MSSAPRQTSAIPTYRAIAVSVRSGWVRTNLNTVTVYPTGATGDAAPVATLSHGLTTPFGVATGRDGSVYVTDVAANAVLSYPPNALTSGSWPTNVTGNATGLTQPTGIAIDY